MYIDYMDNLYWTSYLRVSDYYLCNTLYKYKLNIYLYKLYINKRKAWNKIQKCTWKRVFPFVAGFGRDKRASHWLIWEVPLSLCCALISHQRMSTFIHTFFKYSSKKNSLWLSPFFCPLLFEIEHKEKKVFVNFAWRSKCKKKS